MAVIVTVEGVSRAFGHGPLFENITFGISDGERVGLLGRNGAGKSTLIQLLSGTLPPDAGQIVWRRDVRVEQLSQNPSFEPEQDPLDAALSDGPPAFEAARRYRRLNRMLQQAQESGEPTPQALVAQLSTITEEMERLKAWDLEARADAMLNNLGLSERDVPIEQLSGGQRKRVALARALLRPSDLLILDEPTNHLDIPSITWLETHLKGRAGALLLVTHDRYFLERITSSILEIANLTIYKHEGSYGDFLEAREAREADQALREHKRVQLAKKELDWLRRQPKARTTKSQSRVERAEALQQSIAHETQGKANLQAITSRLGKRVIQISGLSHRFEGAERYVIKELDLTIGRRERLGIIGPNGAGKSTLLNLLTSRLAIQSGQIEVGETVVFGYYDQESDGLPDDKRVHDYIANICPNIETPDGVISASQMLTRFLFEPARQWTPIARLSGGERRRLYLLKTLMLKPNVLLLDEPTNDLDVETLTVLEDYIDSFDGAVIAVSHDRYFLDRVSEHTLVFDETGHVVEFPGTYSAWKESQDELARATPDTKPTNAPAPPSTSTSTKTAETTAASRKKQLSSWERRELDELPAKIETLEAKLAQLDADLLTSTTDYQAITTLGDQRAKLAAQLDAVMERWMELEERA